MAESKPLLGNINSVGKTLAVKGSLSWVSAGLIIFGFAAPSAVMGVGFSVASSGTLIGPLLNVIITVASAFGALFLLEMVLEESRSNSPLHSFGDICGMAGTGPIGRQRWRLVGMVVQYTNFVLFLPVALMLVALAVQGVIDPTFSVCSDYFVFGVAAVCLLATQARTLNNTAVFAFASLAAVVVVIALQCYVLAEFENPNSIPVRLIGNGLLPQQTSLFTLALAVTTSAWAYVPAYLIAELHENCAKPSLLRQSIWLAAALNVALFAGLGVFSAVMWGGNLQDPITLVAAWPGTAVSSRVLNAFLAIANIVSYALDSIPLVRACQRSWAPKFNNDWSFKSILQYLLISLPTFGAAVVLSVAVPNLFVLLAWVSFLSVPLATQIVPSLVFYLWKSRQEKGMTLRDKILVGFVLIVGIASLIICGIAAVGKSLVSEIRGPSQIGCAGWLLYKSK